MKRIIEMLICRAIEIFFKDKIALAKIRAVEHYVKTVAEVRRFFIEYVLLRCALILMVAGFALLHVALFMYLPWSPEAKLLTLAIIGGFYFVVPAIYVVRFCSQRNWMRLTKASELVEKVTGKK